MQGNKAEGGRERLKGKGLNQDTRLGGRGPNLLSHLPKCNLPETYKMEEEKDSLSYGLPSNTHCAMGMPAPHNESIQWDF